MLLRELSSHTLQLFGHLTKARTDSALDEFQQVAAETQQHLDDANKDLLRLMADPGRRDAGSMTNFVTYSQRLKDKLVNYANLQAR